MAADMRRRRKEIIMSIQIRKADERGHANHGWLESFHTFSFANYYDPSHMGFRSLRVINDDTVAGGGGFGTHPHRDMEIITYVLSGALEHRDSLGNGAVMKSGDVQHITAGTGVQHSEFNYSPIEPVHFLQIWILPDQKSLTPGYEQKSFTNELKSGRLNLVAAGTPRDGALKIHQDADLFIGKLGAGDKVTHELKPNRHAWLQVAEGAVNLNGHDLKTGDGVAVNDEKLLTLTGKEPSQVLLFDLN
ncbi:MAG: Pirin domain protein [Pedosphaera sp.]|nr:Pirin domain protein [Pedosphaera sp.]